MGEANRRSFLLWLSRSGLALATVGMTGALTGRADAATRPDITVLTNATLVDGTGAPPTPNTTIVLMGDRIVAVGQHRVPLPRGVRVIDLRGKYVLPGLWDTHTHTPDPVTMPNVERIYLPLYIANGVTSVREMWGQPHLPAIRDRINRGELAGPRMVIGSDIVDGPHSFLTPEPVKVSTPAEARNAVGQARKEGADFIKVYSLLSADTFAALADEARRIGMPIAGHVPELIRTDSPVALTMTTQEHLYVLHIDVSTERDRIRELIRTTAFKPDPLTWWLTIRTEFEPQASRSYDPRRAAEVFAALAHNGTTLSATLTGARFWWLPPETFRGDVRTKYLPGWVKDSWDDTLGGPWTPERITAGREFYAATQRLLADAARAGVSITAGTDSHVGIPYGFPGFSLHDELALMVQGGITPMRAIQSATRDAARAAGQGRLSGTVTPGKHADLLVVEGNPITDITNTARIHAIITRGRLITRAERERMLAAVEAEAAQSPPPRTPLLACCQMTRKPPT